MVGTVQSVRHVLKQYDEASPFIKAIVQLRKRRPREAKLLAQDHSDPACPTGLPQPDYQLLAHSPAPL